MRRSQSDRVFKANRARAKGHAFSRQSHTFMTQLVATGELRDVIVDGYVHNAVALKGKSAPIDSRHDQPNHHPSADDHRHHGAGAPPLRRALCSWIIICPNR